MLQDAEEISLKVDVSVLKEKVNTLALLCDKMDRVIEKLADNQLDLAGQIYQDMDKRKEQTVSDNCNTGGEPQVFGATFEDSCRTGYAAVAGDVAIF